MAFTADDTYEARLRGTLRDTFGVATVLWKDSAGIMDARNEADTAAVRTRSLQHTASTTLATATAFDALVTADAFPRWIARGDGQQEWGTGALAADVSLLRGAVDRLELGSGDSLNAISGFFQTRVLTGDASPNTQLGGGALRYGSAAGPLDLRLARLAPAGTTYLQIDDNIGGLARIVGAADALLELGTITGITRRLGNVRIAPGTVRCFWGDDTSLRRATALQLMLEGGAAGVGAAHVPASDGVAGGTLGTDINRWANVFGVLGQFGVLGAVAAVDVGTLVAGGITRVGTGLQSFGVGLGAVVGSARGSGAVDLQFSRTGSSQVASGLRSVCIGGTNGTASGTDSVCLGGTNKTASGASSATVGGNLHLATGPNSGAFSGQANTASGSQSATLGGLSNLASATNAAAVGGAANGATGVNSATVGGTSCSATAINSATTGARALADHEGEFSHSCGADPLGVGIARAQHSDVTWFLRTVDAVASTLFLNGATEYTLLINSTVFFDIVILVRHQTTNNTDSGFFRFQGNVSRPNAGATVFISGAAPVAYAAAADAALVGVAAAISITGNTLRIQVTGLAATNLVWVAYGNMVRTDFTPT